MITTNSGRKYSALQYIYDLETIQMYPDIFQIIDHYLARVTKVRFSFNYPEDFNRFFAKLHQCDLRDL